jgi:hypothetical protein
MIERGHLYKLPKPAGCVDVNGQRINIKELCFVLSRGGFLGLPKHKEENLSCNAGNNVYIFKMKGKRIHVEFMRRDKENKDLILERCIGDFTDITEAVRGLIKDVSTHRVALHFDNGIIWDAAEGVKIFEKYDNLQISAFSSEYSSGMLNAPIKNDVDVLSRFSDLIARLRVHEGSKISAVLREYDKKSDSYGVRIAEGIVLTEGYKDGQFGVKVKERIKVYNAAGEVLSAQDTVKQSLEKPAKPHIPIPTQIFAVGRFLDQNKKLAGLMLSDGSQQRQYSLAQCIALAKDSKIKNIKAMTRNGKTFLAGNGISLESLPYATV